MKSKKFTFIFVAIILLCSGIYVYYKNNQNSSYSKDYFSLGTINKVTIFNQSESKSNQLLIECGDILNDIDEKMSTHIQNSEVNKINEKAGVEAVKVSDDTFYVINEAIKYSTLSSGVFDITIGPLVDLWGIGTDNANVPNLDEIKTKLSLINYKNIILDEENKTVELSQKNMDIDLGGIAKGFAADKIASYLKEEGVNNAIINLGGNIYTIGHKEKNTPFKVGIQDPTQPRGNSIATIEASNISVVTSGIYERYLEKDNKIYHHMLSPFTGFPFENNLTSVTIISNKSINCDALSTSAFGLGLEKGMKLIESVDNVDAVFITQDKKIYLSNGIKNNFTLTDNSFTVVD
ncbi:MAG: FAD:protein FMN transferase [Peptostreptococcaceae bacterium]